MALFDAVDGYRQTAPVQAVRAMERAQYVNQHPGWTYRDYDEAAAGDIWIDRVWHDLQDHQADREKP